MKHARTLFLTVFGLLCASAAGAQAFVDIEGGVAFTGYNDVAIPAETGTKISLATDTVAAPAPAARVRFGSVFGGRHTVSVLYAPLTVRGAGTPDRDLSYRDKTFASGVKVESAYRFDSYRLTYRYTFLDSERWNIGVGVTGKVRSADIALMSDSGYAHRSDLGAVPLVNFRAQWNFARPWSALLEADALVTPFGRAEDALLALQYRSSDRVSFRAGYRVLEGGSDGGGNVYTFALFHYLTAGITVGL